MVRPKIKEQYKKQRITFSLSPKLFKKVMKESKSYRSVSHFLEECIERFENE